uniref:Uncharacterized protein n=1 Tax=Octopus bimaculoides TaxID=37653 RepID=A0A0L8HRL0_OCTBM
MYMMEKYWHQMEVCKFIFTQNVYKKCVRPTLFEIFKNLFSIVFNVINFSVMFP